MQKETFKNIKNGTIHTLGYKNFPKQKGLADMYNIKYFQIRFSDYESMAKVKEYRLAGNEVNNLSIVNEVATEVKHIYFNTKTLKYKLRVPLSGLSEIKGKAKFFIGNKEVSKEKYFEEWSLRGYSLPKKSESKSGVEFRSFDLDKIVYFK